MTDIKTKEQFDNVISAGNDIVTIVDFYANWCSPCRTLAPILDEIAKDGVINVVKVDVDQVPDIAQKYGIRGIPTLLYFKNGVIIKTLVGVKSKEEIEKI